MTGIEVSHFSFQYIVGIVLVLCLVRLLLISVIIDYLNELFSITLVFDYLKKLTTDGGKHEIE